MFLGEAWIDQMRPLSRFLKRCGYLPLTLGLHTPTSKESVDSDATHLLRRNPPTWAGRFVIILANRRDTFDMQRNKRYISVKVRVQSELCQVGQLWDSFGWMLPLPVLVDAKRATCPVSREPDVFVRTLQ